MILITQQQNVRDLENAPVRTLVVTWFYAIEGFQFYDAINVQTSPQEANDTD